MARRAKRGRRVDGIVLLDKAAGLTSNRALQRVRRIYDAAKAGHTGSLDPLATGMLPICLGEATKLSGFLLDSDKEYRVAARFGVETDTGDADGSVLRTDAADPPGRERVVAVLSGFVGEQTQVPPMYSALKQDGKRLYELARAGREVERAPRRITIHALELERLDGAELEFRVVCSKGTYVRSLVVDVAAALGTVAHVTALRRLKVAPFAERDMMTEDELTALEARAGHAGLDAVLLPPDAALVGWPAVSLDPAAADALGHGRRVAAAPEWPAGQVRVYGAGIGFLGVGEVLPSRELAPRRLLVR